MIGIARWIGLDLETSRALRVDDADDRFEFDGAPGEAASKTAFDSAGDDE
jgi:hypothetical protein